VPFKIPTCTSIAMTSFGEGKTAVIVVASLLTVSEQKHDILDYQK
jgi:hypothetical protein